MKTQKIVIFTIIVWDGFILALGQGPQYTSNSADQTLRSNGRVNPSLLGMEREIPLNGYKGRSISLPLGLSYSSKYWRLEEVPTTHDQYNYNHAWAIPCYSEDAAAGCTGSLSQPYIEYTGEKYPFGDSASSQGAPLSRDEVIVPPAPRTPTNSAQHPGAPPEISQYQHLSKVVRPSNN